MKDTVKKRRQATEVKKKFTTDTSDKGLLPKIYKELLKLTKYEKTQLKKNGSKILTDT